MRKPESELMSVGHIEINATEFTAEVHSDDLPILATRNLVLFPGVTYPINIVRKLSRDMAEEAERLKLAVGIVCQNDPEIDNPALSDLCSYGVVAQVLKVLTLPDDSCLAIVHAREKIRIDGPGAGVVMPGALSATVTAVRESAPRQGEALLNLMTALHDTLESLTQKRGGHPMSQMMMDPEMLRRNPTLYINHVATVAPVDTGVKMSLLAQDRVRTRGEKLLEEFAAMEQKAEIMETVRERARQAMGERQKSAFLEMEMEEIRRELYGDNDDDSARLHDKIESLAATDEVKAALMREWRKLGKLNPQSPDYQVQMTYIDTVTDMPWGVYSDSDFDFARAESMLNATHSGLDKVKERVIEQMAMMKHSPDGHAPILCLVGPPGVGKTSLGQSIADAMGRKFRRVSLGGLHDESEIRGHRRTYIGAMPGRIADALRRAGTSNPVIMLDEIDKVGADYKGDPSAALLEVLDPEQNNRFHDNYVDIDFDLSKVMFITTANTLGTLSQPLRDRMEVVELSGYSTEEKIEIALEHLYPTMLREFSLTESDVKFSVAALNGIIDNYTAESGVRQLQKRMAAVMRKCVLAKVSGREFPREVLPEHLRGLLGVEPVSRDKYGTDGIAGVVTGLAWTAAGGEILFIEAVLTPGKGEQLSLTGNLGDVMKESAAIARRYVQAHAADFGIDAQLMKERDIHIHVPEGAIPKDGPSAGITMTTAIVSALTGRPVREHVAMTGEMTLRGKVLPVGGIKEKILAAKRAGVKEIIMSADNRKNIEEIKAEYVDGLKFHFVTSVHEVTDIALA